MLALEDYSKFGYITIWWDQFGGKINNFDYAYTVIKQTITVPKITLKLMYLL